MILTYRVIERTTALNEGCVTPDGFFRHVSALRAYRVVHLDSYELTEPRCVSIVLVDPTEETLRTATAILGLYGMPFAVADSTRSAAACESPGGHRLVEGCEPSLISIWTDDIAWSVADIAGSNPTISHRSAVSGKERRYPLRLMKETDSLFRATVAAIITNYNYGRFLREAVSSVEEQIIAPDEFIIVDDASTDMSFDVLDELESSGKTIIRNKTNLGIVENFRSCVANTNSDYVFFLGADNRLRSDFVLECRLALDANPDVDIAYTDVILFGVLAGEQARKVGATLIGHAPTSNWDVYEWQFPDPTPETLARFETNNFVHGSSMYRRSAYDRVGGYRSNGQPEDHNLFYRIWKSGGHLTHVRKPLLEYRQHSVAQANNRSALQVENHGLRKLIDAMQQKFAELEQGYRTQEREILRLNAAFAEQDAELRRVNAAFAEQDAELRRVNAALAQANHAQSA